MNYDKKELKALYKNFLLSACNSEEGKEKRLNKAEEDYKAVEHLIDKQIRVFDVGANGGFFMTVFAMHGHWIMGSELSSAAIAYAFEHFEITTIYYGFLEDTIRNANLFVFWNTLEHLPNPAEALKLVKSHLRKGGMIYTKIPINDPDHHHITVFPDLESIYELFKDFEAIYVQDDRTTTPASIVQLWKLK